MVNISRMSFPPSPVSDSNLVFLFKVCASQTQLFQLHTEALRSLPAQGSIFPSEYIHPQKLLPKKPSVSPSPRLATYFRVSGSIYPSLVSERGNVQSWVCAIKPSLVRAAELQARSIFTGSCSTPSLGINYAAGAVCLARQSNFHSSAVSVRLMKATVSLEWNTKLSFVLSMLEEMGHFFPSP